VKPEKGKIVASKEVEPLKKATTTDKQVAKQSGKVTKKSK
jgi:hypothetical protein